MNCLFSLIGLLELGYVSSSASILVHVLNGRRSPAGLFPTTRCSHLLAISVSIEIEALGYLCQLPRSGLLRMLRVAPIFSAEALYRSHKCRGFVSRLRLPASKAGVSDIKIRAPCRWTGLERN